MLYIFNTREEAYRFVSEVLFVEELFDFDYRFDHIEFPNGIKEELKEKIHEYGGRRYGD